MVDHLIYLGVAAWLRTWAWEVPEVVWASRPREDQGLAQGRGDLGVATPRTATLHGRLPRAYPGPQSYQDKNGPANYGQA
jgi:hypothetical protein